MTAPVPADVLSRLKTVLGESGWSQDPERLAPKLVEWRDRWVGATPLLVLPKTTAEVAAVVGICAEAGVPITPQGGNTGLVGGQIPQGEILLSTERLRAIRAVDVDDEVLIAEAGVTLAAVHETAAGVRRRFPLGLASEGSATVGGFVSTNAGGVQVLRYGMTRGLVLGLEAVLPNGEIWNGLKRLRKDNTGYDLKQLFIGAEGTLGVVTAAALELTPELASRAVAFIGVEGPAMAIRLLARAKEETGGGVESFELISRQGLDFVLRNIPGSRDPLAAPQPWYVLAEFGSGEPGAAEAAMERFLERGLAEDLIHDAVVAQTEGQAKALWGLRENQSAAQKREGATWKHDVAVPVSRIPAFLEQATAAVRALVPAARISAFGHIGDGNIHYDVLRPEGGSDAEHAALREEGSGKVHDIVAALGGSISAEHGLGAMKTEAARRYKSPVEIEVMQAVRRALDPRRIMNPRVLFWAAGNDRHASAAIRRLRRQGPDGKPLPMLIVLSPAKALDFTAPEASAPLTIPQLAQDTAELAQVARKLTAADLRRLMSLSDNLAKLNRERFQAFEPEADDGLQAVFAFNGDVYAGLRARELDKKSLAWAQDHVRILSGLYGVLRPLDAIQPYRMEMGTRLKTKRGQSLYDFWGDRISKALNEAAQGHKDKTLVNCASGEYFGAVDRKALKLPLLACLFLEEKDGEARIISFFAKKARGMMARYAIDNRVERAADLKGFDAGGYRFAAHLSSEDEFTFVRPQPAPPAAARRQEI